MRDEGLEPVFDMFHIVLRCCSCVDFSTFFSFSLFHIISHYFTVFSKKGVKNGVKKRTASVVYTPNAYKNNSRNKEVVFIISCFLFFIFSYKVHHWQEQWIARSRTSELSNNWPRIRIKNCHGVYLHEFLNVL